MGYIMDVSVRSPEGWVSLPEWLDSMIGVKSSKDDS